jgi:hypothetical protein
LYWPHVSVGSRGSSPRPSNVDGDAARGGGDRRGRAGDGAFVGDPFRAPHRWAGTRGRYEKITYTYRDAAARDPVVTSGQKLNAITTIAIRTAAASTDHSRTLTFGEGG